MDAWSIASVERDTGLSKELLRMWERRYGFPQPLRDSQGDRLYPPEQVERLRLLKRLLDGGHRPGKLLALSPQDLALLAQGSMLPAPAAGEVEDGLQQECLRVLLQDDAAAVRLFLQHELQQRGLCAFVLQVAAPTLNAVGQAWFEGRLAVHQEHLYSEELQKVLRQCMYILPSACRPPRIMLTTVPNEIHGLGLLMAEVLLRADGADVRSFGVQLPVADIASAAVRHGVDVVGLSFSASFSAVILRQALRELDQVLPPDVQIWAGGAGVRGLRKLPQRVRRFDSLEQLQQGLQLWRSGQGAPEAKGR